MVSDLAFSLQYRITLLQHNLQVYNGHAMVRIEIFHGVYMLMYCGISVRKGTIWSFYYIEIERDTPFEEKKTPKTRGSNGPISFTWVTFTFSYVINRSEQSTLKSQLDYQPCDLLLPQVVPLVNSWPYSRLHLQEGHKYFILAHFHLNPHTFTTKKYG